MVTTKSDLAALPSPARGGVYWYAKWSPLGKPVVRSLGPTWTKPNGEGGWQRREGRAPEDHLTEVQPHARMLTLVRSHDTEMTLWSRMLWSASATP